MLPGPPNPHPGGLSPLQEFVEESTVGKTCPAHSDVLLQPQVLDLVLHPAEPGGTQQGMAGGWGTCSVPLATEGPAQRCSFWMKIGLGRIPIPGSCSLGSFVSPVHHEAPLLPALLPVPGFLGLVGLDAADVVWRALH